MSAIAGAAPSPFRLREKVLLAIEIVAAYGLARVHLRRRRLQGALAALRATTARRSTDTAECLADARRLGGAVMRVLEVLPADSRCLMRSLVLTRLLSRRGIDSRLVIAVRPGERFAAHAWLEHDGAPLLPTFADYERLVAL